MNRSDALVLVSTNIVTDPLGNQHNVESARVTVFCDIKSVSREENETAGSHGFSEAQKLVLYPWDYSGEELVIIDGKKKVVYRTYQVDADTLELYAASRKGASL